MREPGVLLRWLALSLPLLATAVSAAQRLDVSGHTQRVIAVDGDCRFHPGDDSDGKLGWASTAFDDSAWQTMVRWPSVQSREPNFWLRCRFDPAPVSPDIQPILQVAGDFSYELFLNGHFLGAFGNLLNGRHTAGLVHQYSAAELSDRSHPFLVALRIAVYPTNYDLQPLPQLTVGPSAVLRDQYTAHVARAVADKSVIWLSYIVIAGAGLFFLALYLFDRSQVMLLWVSIAWLSLALIRLSEFLVTASIPIPSVFEYLCYSVGNTNGIATILFFFALAGRPVTRFFRIIAIFSLASTAPLILVPLFPLHQAMAIRWFLDVSPQFFSLAISASCLACLAPLFAFWPLNKIPRNQIPIFLAGSFWMLINFLYMGMQFPGLPFATSEYLKLQPLRSVAMALAAVVMTILLIHRIRATNRQRALFAGELQAARDIQQLLVPAHIDSAPWLHLQAAFLPAREVGGDFYRCRILPDGSQWILLGDVSGKGTAAAMTGAMLLGAAEGRESESPANLLGHLNSALCCSRIAGFVTCLVLRISPSGTLTLANAGHIPPYLAGRELPVQPGLPLGLAAQFTYSELAFTLPAGEQLTLLTDGVVEATNPTSKELFGFDRTAAISTQSASQIAAAAQNFGQEDDITVLTLQSRLPT